MHYTKQALGIAELFGSFDFKNEIWNDGLYSSIFRKINNPTESHTKHYTLFDGDIDPVWIENMNSVMDDNKLVTLANGERIKLTKHCSLLFEVLNHIFFKPSRLLS